MMLTSNTCNQLPVAYSLELVINNHCMRMMNPCQSCRVLLLRQAEMSLKTAQEAIRMVARVIEEKNLPSLGIVFVGGDLSCSFDLIKQIVSFAQAEITVPLCFALDGFCGLISKKFFNWGQEHHAELKSNWSHSLILDILKNENIECQYCRTAQLFVGKQDIQYIREDVEKLYTTGFCKIILKFLNIRNILKNPINRKLVIEEMTKVLAYCKTKDDLMVNLIDYTIKNEDYLKSINTHCTAYDSCSCVDIDGTSYPCSRLSPLFLLRSTAEYAKKILTRNFLERNGEICFSCENKAFCSDCPGDFIDEMDTEHLGHFSKDHCFLAELVLKASFNYGLNLLGKEADNSSLIRNLQNMKKKLMEDGESKK